MTKAELVRQISKDTGIIKKDVALVVDTFLSTIKESLRKGNHIEIRQFGTFNLRVRKGRVGRNPKTNEEVKVPDRVVPTFKYTREFKHALQSYLAIEQLQNI